MRRVFGNGRALLGQGSADLASALGRECSGIKALHVRWASLLRTVRGRRLGVKVPQIRSRLMKQGGKKSMQSDRSSRKREEVKEPRLEMEGGRWRWQQRRGVA